MYINLYQNEFGFWSLNNSNLNCVIGKDCKHGCCVKIIYGFTCKTSQWFSIKFYKKHEYKNGRILYQL